MKQLIFCICILLIIASCHLSDPNKSPDDKNISNQENALDSITIFLTGNIIGYLKPCGCSGGQKGGLDRRPAIFDTVPVDKRLLIDTGELVQEKHDPSEKAQNFIKFLTITEALEYLKYDIVNLTKHDLKISQDNGLIGAFPLNYITSYETEEDIPPGYQNQLILDGEEINIITVSYDPREAPLEYIKEVFPSQSDTTNINILILNTESGTDFDSIRSEISELGVVDIIVCPLSSDEPSLMSDRGEKPLVCGLGRKGRYVCSIEIAKMPDNTLKMGFNGIALEEEIKPDQHLKDLYETYKKMVKEDELLGKNLRFPEENGSKYVGNKICESGECHSEPYKHQSEYVEWMLSDHAKAYQTLVDVNSQYDPECIECHVVGYKYESGFRTLEETPELINVGCEICHGPGSAHCKDPYNKKTEPIEDIVDQCLECHVPEHSGDFAGHEEEKIKIIKHWEEPNDVSDVK